MSSEPDRAHRPLLKKSGRAATQQRTRYTLHTLEQSIIG
jgi:hypothetical protein